MLLPRSMLASRALGACLIVGALGCNGGGGRPAGSGDAGDRPSPPSPPSPSCEGLPATCGADGATSCCASALVPGGTFLRDNGVVGEYTATVSDFRLDLYEIT